MALNSGPLRDTNELSEATRIVADVFNFSAERCRAYFDSARHENIRVVRDGQRVVGSMASLPVGQYFGGRSVPMAGIAAVAIAPPDRSSGAASTMLRTELARLNAVSWPLSCLYPATIPIYRKAGYELAGAQFETRLAGKQIDGQDRALTVRDYQPGDQPALEALYRDMARRTNGNIDRDAFFWSRVRSWRGDPTQGFVICSGGAIEGYIFYLKRPGAGLFTGYVLQVVDLAFSTPAAARRILSFLADHRSMVETVFWFGSPNEALLLHTREQPAKPALRDHWMLRITHVAAALEQRGYAPGLSGELHLDVADDVLPDNGGRFTLVVEDGRAAVSRGGRGSMRIDVRGLASMYSGYYTPHELKLRGYVDADDSSMSVAAAMFGGSTPWMRDGF
ncbi:Enhanced intracellular survival protein [Phycisphaerae bacterium RAS1]|nr:Enhanced intracellular survival protein [Phycisphaerae bacterium RAS1]